MSAPIHGKGRIFVPDTSDARFPLRALLAPISAPQPLPLDKAWKLGPILDQGQTPQCVGYTARQWLSSSPLPDTGGPSAVAIYRGAQRYDETPGEDYAGSSDRGAMKFLQGLGYVGAYHWTASVDEAATYVLTQGTLLIGVNWYEGMETPDRRHVIRPTGKLMGGHETFIYRYNRTRGLFYIANSWGTGWGDRGRCAISGEDLQRLVGEDGDICAPVQSAPTEVPHTTRKAVAA